MRFAPTVRRASTALVAGALVLAACGGDDDSSSTTIESGSGDAPTADEAPAAGDSSAAVLTTGGRELGEELDPASDISTNILPDLLVDDVGRGTKVNIRNIFPADKPVLAWLYAPF